MQSNAITTIEALPFEVIKLILMNEVLMNNLLQNYLCNSMFVNKLFYNLNQEIFKEFICPSLHSRFYNSEEPKFKNKKDAFLFLQKMQISVADSQTENEKLKSLCITLLHLFTTAAYLAKELKMEFKISKGEEIRTSFIEKTMVSGSCTVFDVINDEDLQQMYTSLGEVINKNNSKTYIEFIKKHMDLFKNPLRELSQQLPFSFTPDFFKTKSDLENVKAVTLISQHLDTIYENFNQLLIERNSNSKATKRS